jgi:hypothetical protein
MIMIRFLSPIDESARSLKWRIKSLYLSALYSEKNKLIVFKRGVFSRLFRVLIFNAFFIR